MSATSATLAGRLASVIVRLYPRPWRARYETEVLDLLALRPPTWGDALDLACHLAYHWLHPEVTADVSASAQGLTVPTTIWRTLGHALAPRRAAQRGEPR